MSSCPKIVETGITSAIYLALVQEAAKEGLVLVGPSGDVKYMGCTFHYEIDLPNETVTIECISKPWTMPSFAIEHTIDNIIAAAKKKEAALTAFNNFGQ